MNYTELPEDILPISPATLTTAIVPTTQETFTHIQLLEQGTLGFDMMPYSPESTALAIREKVVVMMEQWLAIGAYLYRAQANMGDKFGIWFDEQGFPLSRNWASQAISAVTALMVDSDLRRAVRNVRSIKKFQVVARQLALPLGRQEFQEQGTILGKSPEEIDGMSLKELKKQAEKAPKLEARIEELEGTLTQQSKELENVRGHLFKLKNPDLNEEPIRKSFMVELNNRRATCVEALRSMSLHRRPEFDALGAEEVLAFYAFALYLDKEVALLARTIEHKWGHVYKELLQDDTGRVRDIGGRRHLQLTEEAADTAWEAAVAAGERKPLTLVNTQTGEVLWSTSAPTPQDAPTPKE